MQLSSFLLLRLFYVYIYTYLYFPSKEDRGEDGGGERPAPLGFERSVITEDVTGPNLRVTLCQMNRCKHS